MLDALTLDQMRIFAAVAETGSFSAAARRVGRVQSAVSQSIAGLEDQLGVALFDRSGKTPRLTPGGAAILADARRLLEGARAMRERASSIAAEIEPELAFAVDAVFPNAPLMASLKALRAEFPMMPVSIFTESLGGSEQRLRDGVAHFALIPLATARADDLSASYLVSIPMLPVVSVNHPLAREKEPIARETLEPHIQLVLTDRTPLTQNMSGGIVSRQIWRFADISTRLEFLLEGFGWCNMPEHMVRKAIDEGRLKALNLAERDPFQFRVHVVHVRGRDIGRAGRWLIEDLRGRLVFCVETGHAAA